MAPSYRFGDVVEVEYPYTDFSGEKKRPAVVVSSDLYHSKTTELILLPITGSTWIEGEIFGTVEVLDLNGTDLKKPSVIKAAPHTVARNKVLRKRGSLDSRTRANLVKVLSKLLYR